MTKIYLDIDGVILANDYSPSKHAEEFIEKENYVIPLLSRFFSGKTLQYLKQIKPTNWNINKTEAIDFSVPFLWFDDDLFLGEKEDLIKHNVLDNWIHVDLRKDENALEVFLASFPIPIQLVK